MSIFTNNLILIIGEKTSTLTHVVGNSVRIHIKAHWKIESEVTAFKEVITKNQDAPIQVIISSERQIIEEKTITANSNIDFQKEIDKILLESTDQDYFATSILIGKSEQCDLEQKYIFLSIPNNEIINFWINFVIVFPNQFRGIYSQSAEEQIFLSSTITPFFIPFQYEYSKEKYSNWEIMVTNSSTSGYQLVALKEGIVNYARTLDISDNSTPDKISKEIEKKIIRTIVGLKLSPHDRIDLVIIVSAEIKKIISSIKTKANNSIIITPEEISQKINHRISSDNINGYIDEIFSAIVVKSFPLYPLHHRNFKELLKLEKLIITWKKMLFVIPILFTVWGMLFMSNLFKESQLKKANLIIEKKIIQSNEEKKNLDLIASDPLIRKFIPLSNEILSSDSNFFKILTKLRAIKLEKISINEIKWKIVDKDYTTILRLDFLSDATTENDIFEELDIFISEFKKEFSDYTVNYERDSEIDPIPSSKSIPAKITIIESVGAK